MGSCSTSPQRNWSEQKGAVEQPDRRVTNDVVNGNRIPGARSNDRRE